jgi:hypothetical protein
MNFTQSLPESIGGTNSFQLILWSRNHLSTKQRQRQYNEENYILISLMCLDFKILKSLIKGIQNPYIHVCISHEQLIFILSMQNRFNIWKPVILCNWSHRQTEESKSHVDTNWHREIIWQNLISIYDSKKKRSKKIRQ